MTTAKKKKSLKVTATPWTACGQGWLRKTYSDGHGSTAPAREILPEVLAHLIDAIALNCGGEELEQAYGKEIADAVMEAKEVLRAASC